MNILRIYPSVFRASCRPARPLRVWTGRIAGSGRPRRSWSQCARWHLAVARGAGRAAALLHSAVRNRALVDGNKRLALAAVIAFSGLNGRRLTLANGQAYDDLVISVAAGQLDDADAIAAILRNPTQPRS